MFLFVQIVFLGLFCFAGRSSDAVYKDTLSYQDVTWLTSHNSFAYPADGYYFKQQNLDIDAQLDYGVRSFMLDLYEISEDWGTYAASFFSKRNGTIALCHGFCYGNVTKRFWNFLIALELFLSANPKEIITLHLESYIDDPQKILDDIEAARLTSKLLTYQEHCQFVSIPDRGSYGKMDSYKPPRSWPTLGQLRKHHKNLIIFVEHQKWQNGNTPESQRQYCDKGLYSVNFHRESQYGTTEEYESSCPMRLKDGRDITQKSPLFLMNRFKNSVMGGGENEINSYENIMKQVENCFRTEKIFPNFIALNFVEKGKNGGGKRAVEQLTKNRKALMKKMSALTGSKSKDTKDTNEEHSEF